jgi:hypothetical protein
MLVFVKQMLDGNLSMEGTEQLTLSYTNVGQRLARPSGEDVLDETIMY